MGVGTNIKEYLRKKGISQIWLCESTGITPERMSLSLNEKRKMTFDDYARIIGALGLPSGSFIEPIPPTDNDGGDEGHETNKG